MSAISDRSLPQQMYEYIRERIISGEFAAGQRLKEREISEQTEVSRIPIREALPLLEADGFITIYPRRGAVVRQLTTQDVEELFDVRESLEVLAFRLAAANSRRRPVAALETELRRARDAIARGDEGAAASANIAFHRAVVELADNSLLSMLVQPLFGRMEWLFRMTSDRDVLTQCAEHETLFKAIQSGQSELAASLAFVHITSGRQPTLAKLESHQSPHVVGTAH